MTNPITGYFTSTLTTAKRICEIKPGTATAKAAFKEKTTALACKLDLNF